ncbi:leucine-rich repeat receptor protein kinase exs-like protein [Trifolium pratense]|uniref:Leucine-rich repeat receptor protein kinase exs-like protein n=1 Tax=Trifolium pratense TaxID=57577 RepID=A0A2K3LBY5_TRIPR|nr:leucine-rich repeat receptor protein kinase exs-like protein [Trifolium pratense]
MLHGKMPHAFKNLSSLAHLDLSGNYLDSVSSMLIGNGLKKLVYLDIGNNELYGPIPEFFRNMTSIESLYLYYNNFTSVPSWFCNFEKLTHLDLSFNGLHGPIPDAFRNMLSIESLVLSENSLTSIPSWLTEFKRLVSLDLRGNQLILTEYDLEVLDLRYNHISDHLPNWLGQLEKLKYLDFGSNSLHGPIPLSIGKLSKLQELDLSTNALEGVLLSNIGQLVNLTRLDISSNKLHGSIPQSLGNLVNLAKAPSSVSINVPAPPGLWSNQDVTEVMKGMELEYTKILELVVNMDLSHNNLVGFIPNEITWLTGLHGLNLSKNQLKGEIPQMIGDMKSLESLDMSHNHLSGTIPNSMPYLTSLGHLNLSHNNLSGPIPKDNQFLTFNDPSIYAYNPYLCGSPLPNMCHTGEISHGTPESKGDEDDNEVEKVLFYFVIALGFATGLWGFIGTLWLKKNWRHAYFRWVEDVADKIYVAVVIKVPKIKKKMRRNRVHG